MNRKLFAIFTVVLMTFAGIGLFATHSDESEAADSTASVTVAQGQSWQYTVTTNFTNPSMVLSGSASSWCTLTVDTTNPSNYVYTVSGTVPSIGSTDTTLVITASTIQPTQSYTQTITFTIVEGIEMQLGENVNGVYVLTTDTLFVSGTGDMYTWTEEAPSPAKDYLADLVAIDIGEGVTSIGEYFLYVDDRGTETQQASISITGGEGLTFIGAHAFHRTNVTSVDWFSLESLESIRTYAFANCRLDYIIIPDNVTGLGNNCFQFEGNLSGATVNFDSFASWIALGNGVDRDDMERAFRYSFMQNSNITFSTSAQPGNIYILKQGTGTDFLIAYRSLLGTAANSTYSNNYVYAVAGKSLPNSAEDNVTFTTSSSNNAYEGESLPALVQTMLNGIGQSTWIGSSSGDFDVQISSTSDTATITSGTAEDDAGTWNLTAVRNATYTDGASITFMWRAAYTLQIVEELAFTSTP